MHNQKILSGLRISIPSEYANFFDLKKGDAVLLDRTNNGILIIPAEVRPRR